MLTPLDYLAKAHHKQQVEEAFVADRSVRRFFADVDLHDRAQVRTAIDRAAPTLLQRRARSVSKGTLYYRSARELAGHRGPLEEAMPQDDTVEARLRNSLWVMARGRLSERDRRYGAGKAREINLSELAGAAVRHTLDGGRQAIIDNVRRDRVATGFVRMTSMDDRVCYFCAMLASRQDYKGDSFKRSDPRFKVGDNPLANAKVHDRCRCSIVPIFAGQDTPDYTLHAEKLWYELSEGDGREALRSFRRNYEARLRAGIPVWQEA